MSSHREILAALERLKSGAATLTSEQYVGLLEAVEQAAEALFTAPRGADPVAAGLWYNHERAPALARLGDALTTHQDDVAVRGLAQQQQRDGEIARQLHQSLLDNVSK
ncbi:MAG TPA: hypothetical protein VHV75_01670 [Solirubrobacteraceae bacterium]|jgi:hypothetical protein|nr:hypothetical protein [Solirubrobacteraceae bacterium]